jgi:hypothetical protein
MPEWMTIFTFIISLATPAGYAGYKIFKNCKFKFTIEGGNHEEKNVDDKKNKDKEKPNSPKSNKTLPFDFRYHYPQYYGFANPQAVPYGNIPIQHMPSTHSMYTNLQNHRPDLIPIQQTMNGHLNMDRNMNLQPPTINTTFSRYTNSRSESISPRTYRRGRSASPSAVSAHARINSNHVPIIVSRNVQTRQRSSSSSNTQCPDDETDRRISTNSPNSHVHTIITHATAEELNQIQLEIQRRTGTISPTPN